jgi:molecular chaperone DnaK
LVEDLVQRTAGPCKQALADAGLRPDQIDEVVLVGGSTRTPQVQEVVRQLFGKEPHRGVNPDEVVAVGAAIQGGVLAGEVRDVVLLDVTPLSLGVETLGGVFTRLIERNTTIPTRKSETFSTASDSQPQVEIHALQGERQLARDNRSLGRFILDGIPPAPRGVPQIEVAFDIDANGILHVAAKDKGTGKEQSIRIEASSGLNEDEIKRMVKDADAHAAEDQKRRESIETRNRADQLVYETQKQLKEHGDKLDAALKAKVEAAVERVREALKGSSDDEVKSAVEGLEAAWSDAARALYQAAGAGSGAPPPAGGPEVSGQPTPGAKRDPGDGAVDADFEVMN